MFLILNTMSVITLFLNKEAWDTVEKKKCKIKTFKTRTKIKNHYPKFQRKKNYERKFFRKKEYDIKEKLGATQINISENS